MRTRVVRQWNWSVAREFFCVQRFEGMAKLPEILGGGTYERWHDVTGFDRRILADDYAARLADGLVDVGDVGEEVLSEFGTGNPQVVRFEWAGCQISATFTAVSGTVPPLEFGEDTD